MQPGQVLVRPMSDYPDDVAHDVAAVFVDGYYQDLSFFSRDRAKLAEALEHAFRREFFHLAELDGEVVGILACTHGKHRAMHVRGAPLRASLGVVRGTVAHLFLRKELNIPLPYADETAYIECVATHESARGKGVATTLTRHVMETEPYQHYVLEVVDTNEGAIRIYEKLGFREFHRHEVKGAKRKGFSAKIHMEWRKEQVAHHDQGLGWR